MNVSQKSQYNVGKIINSNISTLSFKETVSAIETWISKKQKKYVCICNTQSLVTASNDITFEEVLNEAGLCTPDGMPLVWALKSYGYTEQERVDGPNLMLKLCELSIVKNYKIFLYGGTKATLDELTQTLLKQYDGIKIVGAHSPPFRQLTQEEDNEVMHMINSTGADIVFVSLGCPKQEYWMYHHRDRINGIMIGVGAAFDFITGRIKRPPLLFQRLGLEWLFRLFKEPKRLWKRYAYNNPMYIYRFLKTYRKNKNMAMTKSL
ncbi:WecB/TagA/CpsF family glycosyltransferase [Cytobacillus firmus]|uniref:WecB/TagA/CpsF family glycosyltransferase n=1 Tax=Paenibacillus lautus TaxID=1401 RepID=UPI0038509069|nr:WecB/TagA/CpsF family glycosyltransferase [Cytobacillus firmus]